MSDLEIVMLLRACDALAQRIQASGAEHLDARLVMARRRLVDALAPPPARAPAGPPPVADQRSLRLVA